MSWAYISEHNYQTVRVLSRLEESHFCFDGSNSTWQLLEGCLWHTRVSDGEGNLLCTYNQMDPFYLGHEGYFDEKVFHLSDSDHCVVSSDCSCTIEGQIVAISDEIAQRSHDIDDAISSGLLSLDELGELLDHFTYASFAQDIKELRDELDECKKLGRCFVDEESLVKQRLASMVATYLIDASKKRFEGYEVEDSAA